MPVESQSWFEEILEIANGRTFKIKINKIIDTFDSEFQRIEIYETKSFGRMLVIDGVVMCTEWDEYAYHEMIAHVPMCVHPNPESVLVIGGGDGGTMREVLKHPSVKRVDICEIDREVINFAIKYLPTMSCSFSDPRVTVYNEDGAKFVREHKNTYDIILVDSSDPIGPAVVLFTEEFYADMRGALKDDGIAATQAESFFYHADIIEKLVGFAKKLYAHAGYYYTMVPTYPSGVIGFTFCSKKYHPLNDFNEARVKALGSQLNYYNADAHRGAFFLPTFIKKRLES